MKSVKDIVKRPVCDYVYKSAYSCLYDSIRISVAYYIMSSVSSSVNLNQSQIRNGINEEY